MKRLTAKSHLGLITEGSHLIKEIMKSSRNIVKNFKSIKCRRPEEKQFFSLGCCPSMHLTLFLKHSVFILSNIVLSGKQPTQKVVQRLVTG